MSVTKIGQGQIKGNGNKVDLNAELSAVEIAIQAAVGGTSYEDRSGVDLSLKDLSGMFSKGQAGEAQLDKDVIGAGHQISGLNNVQAVNANFNNTHGGVIDGSSLAVTGQVSGASAVISGQVGAGSLVVQNAGQVKGDFVIGNNVEGSGHLTVWGDLTVKGNTVTLDTSTLMVEDDRIVMAKGFADKDGAGFVLGSDGGAHKMVWDAGNTRWVISDGVRSPDFRASGKTLVDGLGVHGHADGLSIDGAGVVQFKDSFMPAAMDLSKADEYAPVFGAQGWAKDLGLIGALNKAHLDAIAYADSSYTDLSGDLAAEIARATAAEAGLAADIATEAAARAAADLLHDAAISAEAARATAAEAQLSSDLSAEIARATAAEAANASAISAEVSRATAAEATLTSGLAAEVSRATAAEGVLTTNLATEVTRAQAAEAVLAADIAALELVETGHYAELQAEITRATAAETLLTQNLAAEVSRALAAEAGLASDISAEVVRATAAEGVLTTNLAAEVSRATAAEGVLTSGLAAEVSRATAAEASLAADLATETAARIAGDADLQTQLNTLVGKIAAQATKVFMAVIPNGPDLAMDSDLTGYAGDEFVMPQGKAAVNYDMYLNGQQMVWNQDFIFSNAGKVQFKFALKAGDVVRFREF